MAVPAALQYSLTLNIYPMRRFFFFGIAILSLILLLASLKPNSVADRYLSNEQKLKVALDSLRNNLSDSLGVVFPSVSVLIQTPNDKLFVSSVAPSAEPVTPGTYYRFASNTKNFTATSILNMHEDGWLNYKAKITDKIPGTNIPYVPNNPDWKFPYKDAITIEQLLQHSAGVYDVDNDSVPGYNGQSFTEFTQNTKPGHQFTTDEMVKLLVKHNLSYFKPGQDYHYSNTGYSILAKIIATVYSNKAGTVKTYADYLNDYIIGGRSPVPLKTVHFPVSAADSVLPKPFVTGFMVEPKGTVKIVNYNMSAQVGEGNGYGTIDDLNNYIRSLMRGENVLDKKTVELMKTSTSSANPGYALGCNFREGLGYGHNGSRIGYLSLMAYDPENDISIVSMIHLTDYRSGESFMKCFRSIYDAANAARNALGYTSRP
jgi:D-alanyl-D-alanine carboxypeptidase